jgi:hypothetical protein
MTTISSLMLFREVIAVYSEKHTKHINTLCVQNAESVTVKEGGTYFYHRILKGSSATPVLGVEILQLLNQLARPAHRSGPNKWAE